MNMVLPNRVLHLVVAFLLFRQILADKQISGRTLRKRQEGAFQTFGNPTAPKRPVAQAATYEQYEDKRKLQIFNKGPGQNSGGRPVRRRRRRWRRYSKSTRGSNANVPSLFDYAEKPAGRTSKGKSENISKVSTPTVMDYLQSPRPTPTPGPIVSPSTVTPTLNIIRAAKSTLRPTSRTPFPTILITDGEGGSSKGKGKGGKGGKGGMKSKKKTKESKKGKKPPYRTRRPKPTESPAPSISPKPSFSVLPTMIPSAKPSNFPTGAPSLFPSAEPTISNQPTATAMPTGKKSKKAKSKSKKKGKSKSKAKFKAKKGKELGTLSPTPTPGTDAPSAPVGGMPTDAPAPVPTSSPIVSPTVPPISTTPAPVAATQVPTMAPTGETAAPVVASPAPSSVPSGAPSAFPGRPSPEPSSAPSASPGDTSPEPSFAPSASPGNTSPEPSSAPSASPGDTSPEPSFAPSASPGNTSPEPSSAPSQQPMAQNALDCSFQRDIVLRDDLIMRQVTNQETEKVTIQLEYTGTAWLGFAFSETSSMVPNVAVIGQPDADSVDYWNLESRSLAGVSRLGNADGLTETSIVQEGGTTILTFTRDLIVDGQTTVNGAGTNRFNWAVGSSNLFPNTHVDRDSVEENFVLCLEN